MVIEVTGSEGTLTLEDWATTVGIFPEAATIWRPG